MTNAWFWPGRILFDGLQHRWSKWVLDYGTDEQAGVFAGLFSRDPQTAGAVSGAGRLARWLGGALVVLMLLGGLVWARRGTAATKLTPATRMYLQLRESCLRAGVAVLRGTTPLALVEQVRENRATAARPAERVVDLYLRARYGGERLGESELREMREALGAARRCAQGTDLMVRN